MQFDFEKRKKHLMSEFAAAKLILVLRPECPRDADHAEAVWYDGAIATIAANIDDEEYLAVLYAKRNDIHPDIEAVRKLCKDDKGYLALLEDNFSTGISCLEYQLFGKQYKPVSPMIRLETSNIMEAVDDAAEWFDRLKKFADDRALLNGMMTDIAAKLNCACQLEDDLSTVLVAAHSPEGQDVSVAITCGGDPDSFARKMKQHAEWYDPDVEWAKNFFADAAEAAEDFLKARREKPEPDCLECAGEKEEFI